MLIRELAGTGNLQTDAHAFSMHHGDSTCSRRPHANMCPQLQQTVEESALLDLKHLLMEAQQRVPPVLMALEDPAAEMEEVSVLSVKIAS